MKNIAVWKVVLLSIVTLGVYLLVWLALRRSEMVSKYEQKIPHWLWLIIPSILITAFAVPVAIATVASNGSFLSQLFAVALFGIFLLLAFVAYVITVWWIWQFGKAAGNVVNGKTSALWTALHYVFLGAIMVYVLQFYFNRADDPATLKKQTRGKPTTKFVVLSVILIVLSLGSGVATAFVPPTGFETEFLKQASEIEEKGKKAEELSNQYTACTTKLETDFPEVTVENASEYDAAYAACDEIRVEQHEAADAYNKAIGL